MVATGMRNQQIATQTSATRRPATPTHWSHPPTPTINDLQSIPAFFQD